MKMIKILPAITASLFERNKCHLLALCLFALGLTPPFGGGLSEVEAQNIGISTDASAPETGLMLDIKMPSGYPKAADNAAQPFFQIKSFDADASALKLRMGLRTHSAPANRYAFLEFLEAGTPTYLPLALQPSGGNVGIGTTTPLAKLDVTSNSSTLPSVPSDAVARFANANATPTRIVLDGFGAGTNFTMRMANGTAASPSALLANNAIGALSFWGYGATGYSMGFRSQIVGFAAENWTDLAQGTYMSFRNTPIGSTASAEYMRIDPSGNVGIGTASPSSTFHVSGSSAAKVATVTAASYTAAGETHILANAASNAITITLPAASTVTDRIYYIKKTDATANAVTIDANASETIDGALTKTLSVQYANMSLVCDGSNWFVENASSGTIVNNGTIRPVALSSQTWSSVSWSTCYSNCEGLTENGYSDWHTPTFGEAIYGQQVLGWNTASLFWTAIGDDGNYGSFGNYVFFRPSDGYWGSNPPGDPNYCRCVR